MAEISLSKAINRTLRAEMARDESVLLIGEDVGELGGIFQTSTGLLEEFGPERVIDAPMAEGGVIGHAVGLALYGFRPVVEIPFADFVWPGFDQVVSELARLRYRSGGQYRCPLVLRLPYGGGTGGDMYQSASPEAHFAHIPGLLVGCPADAADAAGLLRTALRGEDPVVLLEPKRLYHAGRAEVGDDETAVAFGSARIRRSGGDVTLLTYGAMVPVALAAAGDAAGRGIQVELVDLRSLRPLDIASVLASIARTGRAVVATESPRFAGYGAELAATLAERAILHLEAPVARVAGYETPMSRALEKTYLPDSDRLLAAIERVANF